MTKDTYHDIIKLQYINSSTKYFWGTHMKYVVYAILVFAAALLFLPKSGTTQIRNLPLLIAITVLILALYLFRLLKYAIIMSKTTKLLKENGYNVQKTHFLPFAAMLKGRYAMKFERRQNVLNIVFLLKKKKYPHYFFEDIDHIEFYRNSRAIFKDIQSRGGTVSKLVETKLLGKQRLKWERYKTNEADINILLFDKFPNKISDSLKRQELGNGDKICDSKIILCDFEYMKEEYIKFL